MLNNFPKINVASLFSMIYKKSRRMKRSISNIYLIAMCICTWRHIFFINFVNQPVCHHADSSSRIDEFLSCGLKPRKRALSKVLTLTPMHLAPIESSIPFISFNGKVKSEIKGHKQGCVSRGNGFQTTGPNLKDSHSLHNCTSTPSHPPCSHPLYGLCQALWAWNAKLD